MSSRRRELLDPQSPRRRLSPLLLGSLLASLGGSAAGQAQVTGTGQARPDAAAEDEEYVRSIAAGVSEFSRQRYAAARVHFEHAHHLRPNARTLRGLGITSYQLGRYARAAHELDAALREIRSPLTATQRKDAMTLLVRSRQQLGFVELSVSPVDAEVFVDDLKVSDRSVPLDPGPHTVRARATGFQTRVLLVEVTRGRTEQVLVTLSPLRRATPPTVNLRVPRPEIPNLHRSTPASELSTSTRSDEQRRFFVSLQLTTGFPSLRRGMEADSGPKRLYSIPPESTDVFVVTPGPSGSSALESRYIFNVESPWVPDGDSFDDLEGPSGTRTPLPSHCQADGKQTGPRTDVYGHPYSMLEPSKYCVRGADARTPSWALRASLGYGVTSWLAIAVPFRFQFVAGEGFLSHILIGLRGEVLVARSRSWSDTRLSVFAGATTGQIQPHPVASPADGPFAKTGPFGVHTGIHLRARLYGDVGLIFSPEIDYQFPNTMLNVDLPLGVELLL